MNVVREHYLRDDIPCGIIGCTVCPEHSPQQNRLDIRRPSSPLPLSSLFIVDTNVVLHQLDLLQSRCGLFDQLNLVFLQTVIDEVQHQDARTHTRLLSLLQSHPRAFAFSNEHHRAAYIDRLPAETPNDRNDRAIRTASLWYSRHNIAAASASSPPLCPPVIMLTEDSANREKALADALPAVSIRRFVQQHAAAFPQLVEMLAALRSEEKEKEKEKAAASWTYPEHLSAEEVRKGLDSGELRRGTFKVSRDYNSDATVSVRASASSIASSVLIPDLRSMNRAVDGDVVVVQLLPQAQWRRPSTRLQPSMDEQSMVDVAAAAKDGDDQTDRPAACLLLRLSRCLLVLPRPPHRPRGGHRPAQLAVVLRQSGAVRPHARLLPLPLRQPTHPRHPHQHEPGGRADAEAHLSGHRQLAC